MAEQDNLINLNGLKIFKEELEKHSIGTSGGSITKIEQTTTSDADGGENIITATLSNGESFNFTVKNGSKGSTGAKGDKGDTGTKGTDGVTPTIKAASGANISAVGTPSVTASTSGTTTTFTFNNLKGAKGDKGDTGATGARGATGATGATGPAGPGLLKVGTAAANASNCPTNAWYGQYS